MVMRSSQSLQPHRPWLGLYTPALHCTKSNPFLSSLCNHSSAVTNRPTTVHLLIEIIIHQHLISACQIFHINYWFSKINDREIFTCKMCKGR